MFIVIIGCVFFSFNTLQDAFKFILVLFRLVHNEIISFEFPYFMNFRMIVWLIISIFISTPILPNIFKKYNSTKYFEVIKTIFLSLLLITCIVFIVNSTYSPFIYFQF